MSNSLNSVPDVAAEAIFQLEVATGILTKARVLFESVKTRCKEGSAARDLAELGEMFVLEYELDLNVESRKLGAALDAMKDSVAPQHGTIPKRGAAQESAQ